MKKIAVAIWFASAMGILAQDFTPEPLPVTNIVKSPVIMKGIYGSRRWSSTNPPPRMTENCVMDALRMFKAEQNKDGSWAEGDKRSLATPLVSLCYLAHGETVASDKFGATVQAAHKWLLSSNPTGTPERVAHIVALSEFVAIHDPSRRMATSRQAVGIVSNLVNTLSTNGDEPWEPLVRFCFLPPEAPKRKWAGITPEFRKSWSNVQADLKPQTLEGYLALCLTSLGKFYQGGQQWATFNREFAPTMISRQTPDAFYPCTPKADRFACTALAIRSMQIYYAYLPTYRKFPDEEKQKDEVDIEINIE